MDSIVHAIAIIGDRIVNYRYSRNFRLLYALFVLVISLRDAILSRIELFSTRTVR